MELLPFRLDDFLRVAWVSTFARDLWAPRIERIQAAWKVIEYESVEAGCRSCAIAHLDPGEFPRLANKAIDRGILVLPLDRISSTPGVYQSGIHQACDGESFSYRAVIGDPQSVRAFRAAWLSDDDDGIGGLLGYPACCRALFRKAWVDLGVRDPT